MDMTAVDVVVIGGGAQGLVILDALMDAGYACALVSEGDIGGGQTLHSHGFLNTGFGMSGEELSTAAVDTVHPYLRAHGVKLSGDWVILPPSGFPAFAALPPVSLPLGFDPRLAADARQLPDQSFDKRELVESLLQGRRERVIRGAVTGMRGREPVEAVYVRLEETGEQVELRSKAVVIAAGCGSKRLLRNLVGSTPQIEMIKHRVVHMLCLRSGRAGLPTTSVVAMPLGLMLAAHEDHESVTWYVTPLEMGGPDFDDVPDDASASPRVDMLRRATDALQALYPSVATVEGLRVGRYAGYRQDIGDLPGRRLCELVTGSSNVIAALPSGLVGPWLNAADTLHLVRGLADPSGTQPALPHGGIGVRAGRVVEDRPDFVWSSWSVWTQSLARQPEAAE